MTAVCDLDAEGISYWTGYWSKIIKAVAPNVSHTGPRCSYAPWIRALHNHMLTPDHLARFGLQDPKLHHGLIAFTQSAATPQWPEDSADLVDFALTFLEADVMLFQSGYAKKNLLNRLRQSPLTGMDVQRIGLLIRRAVVEGTGLEEYRPLCKLAARLVGEGQLNDLPEWLRTRAQGAILTLEDVDTAQMLTFFMSPRWSEDEMDQLCRADWRLTYTTGLIYPQMDQLVDVKRRHGDPSQQMRRNAYRMWRQIAQRLDVGTDAGV